MLFKQETRLVGLNKVIYFSLIVLVVNESRQWRVRVCETRHRDVDTVISFFFFL